MRLALRASATGVWSWDIQSGTLTWSEEAYAIAGVPVPEPGNLGFPDIERMLHPEDRARVLEGISNATDRGLEYRDEFRIVRADGVVRRVLSLGAVQLDASGRARSILGTIADVTVQREAEEALRARTHELQSITDNTPDIVARFDREMRHLFVNKAVERATGVPVAAFIGKTNRELGMAAALCQQWEDAVRSVFATGQPTSYEFQFDGPLGRRHYAARLVAERSESETIEHVLCVSHDITALKQAERAVLESDRRKDIFLATLAHELRNPLGPIQTGVELLKRAGNQPASVQTLAIMERQVEHMARLIGDLMDVSRIASGKVVIHRRSVCLQEILTQTADAVHELFERASHRLRLVQPTKLLYVDGDPARLTQIVSNLLTNAAKYTPDGGEITLRLDCDQQNAIISVEDTGFGLPTESLSGIFDMFTQINRTLDRSGGGLGIGLAIVRYLVEAHDGNVQAASPGVGQGSTFTVRLPIASAIAAPSGNASAPVHAQPPACRVLIVDDNSDAADLLAQIVSSLGSEAHVASTGEEALRLAPQIVPAIVLLDISLPDMNGYTVARRMRSDPTLASVTLVAVTGWGSDEDRKRSIEAGFDHHHTKPLSANTIVELLRSVGRRC